MKRTTLMRSMAVVMTAAMAVGLTACGNTKEEMQTSTQNIQSEQVAADAAVVEDTADTTATKDISGKITMAGSTSMEKLANAVAESFMAKEWVSSAM